MALVLEGFVLRSDDLTAIYVSFILTAAFGFRFGTKSTERGA